MASKQLGKLRQWAGEVISSKDKTTVSEEFQELEKDIELRREGAAKLLLASEAYQHVLSKKKKNEAFEDAEKLLPLDALGMVMIIHGEQFGDDSAFGTSLVKLGRAHCKVATLQEAYALTFKDIFIGSIEKFTNDIKEYDTQRKKLDSRRLSYDAAIAKFEKLKGSKKDKERKEAEDEMDRARLRYDDSSEEVHAKMHAIQENEVVQLHDLTAFLDTEINFVEQYLNVLRDVKADWYDESMLKHAPPPRADGPTHKAPRSTSVHSKQSSFSNVRSDSSDEGPASRPVLSRRSSTHKRSDSNASKPPSRPNSRASRKRSESVGTNGDKDEKEKKKMSVAGWAFGSKGKKSKDKFATLDDEESDSEGDPVEGKGSPQKKTNSFHSISRKLSRDKSKGSSPKLSARILKPPSLQEKKLVRALHSFSGAADELSFSAGDEIIVVNEVLEDWWMGELRGRKGLFPTTYVEVIAAKPTLPSRPASSRSNGLPSSLSSEGASRNTSMDDDSSYLSSDLDEDHDLGTQPLSAHHSSPFYGGPSDAVSITSSIAEDEDDKFLMPNMSRSVPATTYGSNHDDYFKQKSLPDHRDTKALHSLFSSPAFTRRATATESTSGPTIPGKKVPPPPPPRRSTITNMVTGPPLPNRPSKAPGSQSSPMLKAPTPASSVSSHHYDESPFESATELSTSNKSKGCIEFKQNPFQAKGMCNNCFQMHG